MKTARIMMACAFAAGSLAFSGAALACGPEVLERGVLRAVGPEADLQLMDGRSLRLAGLHPAGDMALPLKPGDAIAFGVLDDADRWSRLPALVFHLPTGQEPVWLQASLAEAGRAAVRPEPALGTCWPLLVAAEARARVRPELPGGPGKFARVEGRVVRIGEGRSAQFVTMVDPAGQRTTGLIQKRYLRRLQQGGVDVAGLRGHIVRLRGVRSLRNPQVIALTRADQIEIVR